MTTEYDYKLTVLEHLKKMPVKLPFIGKYWGNQVERILFVAESHYVNVDDFKYQERTKKLQIGNPDLFYQIQSHELTECFKAYFNTRQIVVDVNDGKNLKGKNIYINLKKVLSEYTRLPVSAGLLSYFSICNYFQRPSYTASGSIHTTPVDEKIAYDSLIHLVEIIKPTIIFFISAKAFDTFLKSNGGNLPEEVMNSKVYCAPHPARPWWNKPSARYNNMPGREFVKYILSTKRQIVQ